MVTNSGKPIILTHSALKCQNLLLISESQLNVKSNYREMYGLLPSASQLNIAKCKPSYMVFTNIRVSIAAKIISKYCRLYLSNNDSLMTVYLHPFSMLLKVGSYCETDWFFFIPFNDTTPLLFTMCQNRTA